MKFFRKLDRYVTMQFIISYAICFLFFLGIFVVVDLVAHVDDIMEAAPLVKARGESLLLLTLWVYLLKITPIFLMVGPYLTVMAAMFCVARFRRSNELIPMVMAGISVFRILLPIFVMSGLLLLGMAILQEYVAPVSAEKRMLNEELLLHQRDQLIIEQEVFRDREGREIVVNRYNVGTGVIDNVEVHSIRDAIGGHKKEIRIHGSTLYWLGRGEGWSMEEGVETLEDLSDPGSEREVKQIRILRTDLEPSDILMRIKEPGDLTYRDIQRAYAMNPQDLGMKILLHYHITFPLSNILLLLLGLPFVLRHESRSTYLGPAMAILICGGYFALDIIMRDLGTKGQIHPLLAAWFASIFCGAVGIYLFDSIKT